MTDFFDPPTGPDGPDEADSDLLLAYLSGELDDPSTTALESRIAADGSLRAALERERALAERFAAASPPPPPGAGDRLRARLDAERAAPAADPAPASLDAARARRRPGGVRWSVAGSVAAVLVAVAVVGANVLTGGFAADGDDLALEDAAEGDRGLAALEDADDGDMQALEAPDEAAETGPMLEEADAADTADTDAVPPTFRIIAPEIIDEGVAIADEEALAGHLADRPGVVGLLGMGPEEADELAEAFAVAVRSAEDFGDGTRPDACLDPLIDDAIGPVVPARVERLVFRGIPVTAYVLVAGSAPGAALDRLEAWALDDSCTVQQYVMLPS